VAAGDFTVVSNGTRSRGIKRHQQRIIGVIRVIVVKRALVRLAG
jgi:hypothetical protein